MFGDFFKKKEKERNCLLQQSFHFFHKGCPNFCIQLYMQEKKKNPRTVLSMPSDMVLSGQEISHFGKLFLYILI